MPWSAGCRAWPIASLQSALSPPRPNECLTALLQLDAFGRVRHVFATRLGNVFVIGEGTTPLVSLPKRKGIKMSIQEERALRPPKGA